jgi:hypothetical protein
LRYNEENIMLCKGADDAILGNLAENFTSSSESSQLVENCVNQLNRYASS